MNNNDLKKLFKGKNTKPYLIAEIGNNHNGSLKLAKKLIIAAKKNGADCVKFQTFSPSSLFSKKSFIKNKELKKDVIKYTLNLNDFKFLKDFAYKNKIEFAATPFSNEEVDFLIKELELKFIKIASMDINNFPLISYIAKKKIPIVLSTGFGNFREIKKSIDIIKKNKCKLIILHCVSEYPPNDKDLNLKRILKYKKLFKVPVGFSDHTVGTDITFAAMAIGASIVEKHFTINKKMKGWDHSISADPEDLKNINNYSKKLQKVLGKENIYRVESNLKTMKFRRSIVAKRNIQKWEKIKFKDLSYKRPGNGIPPGDWKKIVGKYPKKKIVYDEQINLKNLKRS